MSQFVLYLGLGLAAGVLYTGVGLGVVTTFKAAGIVNLAQVGFGMWGAFTFAALREDGRLVLPIPGAPSPSLGAPATTTTALVIALAMTSLLGALSYLLVFRPRDAAASDVKALLAAGWSNTGIVTLSQLVAFLSFQIRVVTGLRVLGASLGRTANAAAGA